MSGLLTRLGARAIGQDRPVRTTARLPFAPPARLAEEPAPSIQWPLDSQPAVAAGGTGLQAERGYRHAPGLEFVAADRASPDPPVLDPAPAATARLERADSSGAPAHSPGTPVMVEARIPSAAPATGPEPGRVPVTDPTSGAISRAGDTGGPAASVPPRGWTDGTPADRARTAVPLTPIDEAAVGAERGDRDVRGYARERTLAPGQRLVLYPPEPLLPPPAATPGDREGALVGPRVPVDGRRDGAVETTEVQVTIGRVEVTAVRGSAPAVPRRERRSRHTMTLDEYLARRRAERP